VRIPEKYMKIQAKFQRALKNGDFSEINAIPLEDLKLAKAYLISDKDFPYYSLLLDKIKEKETIRIEQKVNISNLKSSPIIKDSPGAQIFYAEQSNPNKKNKIFGNPWVIYFLMPLIVVVIGGLILFYITNQNKKETSEDAPKVNIQNSLTNSPTIVDSPGTTVTINPQKNQGAEYIKIEFEPKIPYVYKTIIGSNITHENYPVYIFKLEIINDSKEQTARNFFVMLTSIMHMENGQFMAEQNFEPVRLGGNQYFHGINGSTQFSTATSTKLELDNQYPDYINSNSRIFLSFGIIAHPDYQMKNDADSYSGNPAKPQFRFLVSEYPRWMSSHIPPGKHRFTIAVHFEGGSPVEQAFELEWSGKWSDDFDSMLREIRIKKIKNTNTAQKAVQDERDSL